MKVIAARVADALALDRERRAVRRHLRRAAQRSAAEPAGAASARVFCDGSETCSSGAAASATRSATPTSENGRPLPFQPDDADATAAAWTGPPAIYERVVLENDPIARFSPNILLNFTPAGQLSPLLLGPLAKEAGGFGSCGEVFKDTSDPDYRRLAGGHRKAARPTLDARAPLRARPASSPTGSTSAR